MFITITLYTLSAFFIIFFAIAVARVISDNRIKRKVLKRSAEYEAKQKEFKKAGLKQFKFNNNRTVIFAPNFREANAKYQQHLKSNN